MAKSLHYLAALLLLLTCTTVPAVDTPPPANAAEPGNDAALAYWLRQREGWFWYQDPPPPPPLAQPKPTPQPPSRSPELVAFEAMQKQLEDLKRVAVMNPTEANLLAYMRYQRAVMNRSEVFAERWQKLVWTVPELDYSLTGRPTNATAITVYDEQQREKQAQAIRALASTHGLLFIFRSDCPYCHRFAPILKRFEQDYGITVFAVSLDGRGLPEYPHPQPDNGIAARMNATTVPALYLTAPSRRDIRPVGFGLMALTELVERIAALAQERRDNPL